MKLGPEGPPTRSRGPEGPRTSSAVEYFAKKKSKSGQFYDSSKKIYTGDGVGHIDHDIDLMARETSLYLVKDSNFQFI